MRSMENIRDDMIINYQNNKTVLRRYKMVSKAKKHEYYLKWYKKKFKHLPHKKGRKRKATSYTSTISEKKKKQYYLKWYNKKFGHKPHAKGVRKGRKVA